MKGSDLTLIIPRPHLAQALHDDVVSKADYVDRLFSALDSRGKGKLDMIEIRKLLTKIKPDLMQQVE